MSSRPFRVVVVADDRKILRRLARFLSVFGFQVDPVADGQRAVSVCRAQPPDFLIVDGDSSAMEQSRQLFAHGKGHYTYTFLLVRDADVESLTEALVAGVDDFLAKPLVYGELLARMRSGARVVEYERRMREQSAADSITGLLNEAAYRHRLAMELADAPTQEVACVQIDLDFFEHLAGQYGASARESMLRSVAQCLAGLARDGQFVARFEEGRFAVALPGASDAQALAWAESVRQAIAELEVPIQQGSVSVTASLGVAGIMHGSTSADELLRRAESALRTAQASGRNCVARCGQFDGETREWEDLARQGRLFENTVARDVMIPCSALLAADDDLRRAVSLCEQSRLNDVPVVDRKGKIVGLVGCESWGGGGAARPPGATPRGAARSGEVCPRAPAWSFASLMRLFMDDAGSHRVVVVVRHDVPLGLIYRSGLAALSEPLTEASFAPDVPYSTASDYLVIPDFVPAS